MRHSISFTADLLDLQRFLPALEREGQVRKYDIDERLSLSTVGQPSVHGICTILSREISCVSVGRSRPTTSRRGRDGRRTRLPRRRAQDGQTSFAVIELRQFDVGVSTPSQTFLAHRAAPGIALQCKEPAMLAARCVSSTNAYTLDEWDTSR